MNIDIKKETAKLEAELMELGKQMNEARRLEQSIANQIVAKQGAVDYLQSLES